MKPLDFVSRRRHPAEIADRADGARCTEFNAYFFRGRGQRLVGPLTTLDEAVALALEWERLHGARSGRRAAVYGRKPEGGSVWLYEDVWRPEVPVMPGRPDDATT